MLLIFYLLSSLHTFATSINTQSSESTGNDKNNQVSYVPTCYNCQELGHIKRYCPTLKCYKCKKLGHFASDCLENNHYFECDTSKLKAARISQNYSYEEFMKIYGQSLPSQSSHNLQNKDQKTFEHFQKKKQRNFFTSTQNQLNSLKSTSKTWNFNQYSSSTSKKSNTEPNFMSNSEECNRMERNNQSSRLLQPQNYGIPKEKKDESQKKTYANDNPGIQQILQMPQLQSQNGIEKQKKVQKRRNPAAVKNPEIDGKRKRTKYRYEEPIYIDLTDDSKPSLNSYEGKAVNKFDDFKLSRKNIPYSSKKGTAKENSETFKTKNVSESPGLKNCLNLDSHTNAGRYGSKYRPRLHLDPYNERNHAQQIKDYEIQVADTLQFKEYLNETSGNQQHVSPKLENQTLIKMVVDEVVASLLTETNVLAVDKDSEEPNYNSSLCTDSGEDCAKLKRELDKK